ncbi:HAD-IIIC family phosphatase [Candidatus Nitrosopelagicus sp.]|nr:HAD-IIIC family phosphatase [Candidatus Nitrosopelagicus sp.]
MKIAILSSFTLNGLSEILHVKCSELGIGYRSFVAGYNQYAQELINSKSEYYKFSPDVTFLIIDIRNLLGENFFFPYNISDNERKSLVSEKINHLENIIMNFEKNLNSKLIIANFNIPSYSPNGVLETKFDFGFHEMIEELNKSLRDISKNHNSIYVYNFNQFISKYGEKNIFDYRQFHVGDIQIALNFLPQFGYDLMSYIKPITGTNRKCIVLDLDNTLWGGIIGEDGFDGIELGHSPNGKAFVDFQKELLSLWNQGIILAINSKNNFDDAMNVIKEHPNMILREKNFASIKINWNDKAENLKQIANEINIGLNSIVFFDDDKLNQERIKHEFPEVLTVELSSDPSYFSAILKDLNDFNVLQRTEDDVKRGEMYAQQRERKEFQKSISNLDDFLEQLDIQVKMKKTSEFLIPRISQLTLKTNQFNLTTKRYQEEEIRNFANNDKFIVGCAQVLDKFGDNGITGVYIINKEDKVWNIDTFLLSCRIMGRGVENGILSQILIDAKNNGIEEIRANFIPTKKNKPAENFLSDFGFEKNNDYWIYKLNNEIKLPKHLKVEIE